MSVALRLNAAYQIAQADSLDAEEKARVASEAAHTAAETARVASEAAHAATEASRVASEAAHAAAEKARVASDALRSQEEPSPKVTLPVFCTGDEVGLRKGHIRKEDFKDIVAFSYQLKKDLSVPFNTLSHAAFVSYVCSIPCADTGDFLTPTTARKIHKIMTQLTSLIGKMFVVAVAGSQGGGLEIRRITGPYRYSESVFRINSSSTYFHQFPTELVRKLSQEESKEVALRRTNCYAMLWDISISIA